MAMQREKPRYKQNEKIYFIPEETEINQLIYGSGKKLGTALRTAKETAARIGEIVRIRWTDIDFKNKTLSISDPEKGSKAGIYRVSDELVSMISSLPRTSDRLFPTSTKPMVTRLCLKRRQLATTYDNPRLKRISFHTLRHWKGTMLYHETHDILYVKEFLRHRNIENTMIYISLEKQIFQIGDSRGFHVKVAKTIEEACELAKAGFEKFDEFSEGKIYRKRNRCINTENGVFIGSFKSGFQI
jgi:integrase